MGAFGPDRSLCVLTYSGCRRFCRQEETNEGVKGSVFFYEGRPAMMWNTVRFQVFDSTIITGRISEVWRT